jgi:electron transfer flavoprotein beta subunit
MNIVVCIKQIIDPEIPAEQFRLDPTTRRQIRGGLSLVISAYDQNALEVALQLRERGGGTVTALCLGERSALGAVKTALGMSVDAGVLVSDPVLLDSEAFGVAHVLARAVQRIEKLGQTGTVDLVLTGCVSGDTGRKVMPPLLAEALGWGCVTFATRVQVEGGRAVVRRIVDDGYEVVEGALPLVLGILSDDTNVPRYSKLKDIMAAAKKPVPTWTAADLGVDPARVGAGAARLRLCDMQLPQRESHCELVDGQTPQEQGARLAERLRALKVI